MHTPHLAKEHGTIFLISAAEQTGIWVWLSPVLGGVGAAAGAAGTALVSLSNQRKSLLESKETRRREEERQAAATLVDCFVKAKRQRGRLDVLEDPEISRDEWRMWFQEVFQGAEIAVLTFRSEELRLRLGVFVAMVERAPMGSRWRPLGWDRTTTINFASMKALECLGASLRSETLPARPEWFNQVSSFGW